MANLASLFAMPLALVAEDVKENQKSHHARTDSEANQKESDAGLKLKFIFSMANMFNPRRFSP